MNKNGPPDIVIVVPLEKECNLAFEQVWLDLFARFGQLYDRRCMNMSSKALGSLDCLSPEQRRENGRKGAAVQIKGLIGIHGYTTEQRRENYQRGLAKLTIEQRREIQKKSDVTQKKNGTGYRGLTPEQRSEAGKKGAATHKENGTGFCYSLSAEQRIENGKKIRKLTDQQVHDIRHLLALEDMTQVEIAYHFPVTNGVICRINSGRSYADV